MIQTLHTLGGDPQATPLHIAVANGFPPATYAPLLRPLMANHHVISLPPRAMWLPQRPTEDTRHWSDIADDLLVGFNQHRIDAVVGVGHSFGAIATLIAALKASNRFKRLILLDPTVLEPRILWLVRLSRWFQFEARQPLAQGALRRRSTFSSVDEAYEYWRGKRLFNDWSDEMVRLYAESLTRPAPNGGVELVWPPVWEAHYFKTIPTNTWRIVKAASQLTLPILIVRGSTSDTLTARSFEQMRKLLPNAQFRLVEGHGHLFPQSAVEATQQVILDWIKD